jgi:hypothetical protein
MAVVPIKYPLDPTGISPANKVVGEAKTLTDATVRVFATSYGPFYTESLVVKDVATNRILKRNVDYFATEMYQLPTEMYGKEICAVVVVTDKTCGANIAVTYQALGGEFSYSYDAIVQLISKLNLDKRPVAWGNIIDKPTQFDPAAHLHDAGDVYGMEYIVNAIDRLGQIIQVGSLAGESKMYNYIDNQVNQLYGALNAYAAAGITKQAIVTSLGYTPANAAGDTFTGPVTASKGFNLSSFLRESIVKIDARGSETVLDLSAGSIFWVKVYASTGIRFDISKIPNLVADQSISFTVIITNAVANAGISFVSTVNWAGGDVPPRTVGLNGRDEYYFSTFNSGSSYTGSLSNQDVK